MSLRDYLDENDTIGTIRALLRHPQTRAGVWVLVEGTSDIKLYGKFLRRASVEEVAGGVPSLQRALSTLASESRQVLGIRDADFLVVLGHQEEVPALFYTDAHDSEMMMVHDDDTFGDLVAYDTDYASEEAATLRTFLMEALRFLSGVRLLNQSRSLGLNLARLNLGTFFDGEVLDEELCVAEINRRSPKKKRPLRREEVLDILSEGHDLFQLTNGHDFTRAFAIHANRRKRTARGRNKAAIKERDVTRHLCAAYRLEAFEKTALYKSLKAWEEETGLSLGFKNNQ